MVSMTDQLIGTPTFGDLVRRRSHRTSCVNVREWMIDGRCCRGTARQGAFSWMNHPARRISLRTASVFRNSTLTTEHAYARQQGAMFVIFLQTEKKSSSHQSLEMMREGCVSRGRSMKTLILIAVMMPLLGCATFQNTPAQDRTWAAWYACRAENRTGGIQVVRVDPSGYYAI